MKLYHRTPWPRAKKILQNGFLPTIEKKTRVECGYGIYCVCSLADANNTYNKRHYGNGIVEITVPDNLEWETSNKVDFMHRTKLGDNKKNRIYDNHCTNGMVAVLWNTETIEQLRISKDNGKSWYFINSNNEVELYETFKPKKIIISEKQEKQFIKEYLDKDVTKPLYDYLKNGLKYNYYGNYNSSPKFIPIFFKYAMNTTNGMTDEDFVSFSKAIHNNQALGGVFHIYYDKSSQQRFIDCFRENGSFSVEHLKLADAIKEYKNELWDFFDKGDGINLWDDFIMFINGKKDDNRRPNNILVNNLDADAAFTHIEPVLEPQWLIHITQDIDNAKDICQNGFKYGMPMDKLDKLAYSNAVLTKDDKNGKIAYAYDALSIQDNSFKTSIKTPKEYRAFENDFDEIVWQYGMQSAVMFVANGVQGYHMTDKQYQVMFNIDSARNFVLIIKPTNEWLVMTRENKVAYRNQSISNVTSWVIENFEQYRKKICWSHSSKINEGKNMKRINITEEQENILVKEAMQGGFSFESIKHIQSFKERLKYCKEHFGQVIGNGSSRVCFQIDDNWVLKLAKNEKGIAQNTEEGQYDYYRDTFDCTPKINYDLSDMDNFTYIVAEYILPAKPKDFIECLGIDFATLCSFLKWTNNQYSRVKGFGAMNNERATNLIEDNEAIDDIYNYLIDYRRIIGDFCRITNWGMVLREGNPTMVMLDNGFTEDIFRKYYMKESVDNEILKENIKIHKGENGRKYSTQGKWDKEITCPHCNGKAYFSMSISDGNKGRGRIKVTDEDGKEIDSEVQTIGLYYCPKCYKFIARNNMA